MKREWVVETAEGIRQKYEDQGLRLTLRQMYYQFVSMGLVENGQKVYKALGSALTEARKRGEFPIDGLEDRGRDVGLTQSMTSMLDVDEALTQAAADLRTGPLYLQRDRWFGQPVVPSVWVEKEALAGVFTDPCESHDVGLFPCKGYPSLSALWTWLKDASDVEATWVNEGFDPPRFIVFYFGDHDPDGWEIPRAAERTLYELAEAYSRDLDFEDFSVDFRRIALNADQIAKYRPPPFPAKETSARFAGYVQEHGHEDAWELDALEPRVLRNLIESSLAGVYDWSVAREMQRPVTEAREEMKEQMTEDWVREALGEED